MTKILLPVDGSKSALEAVREVIGLARVERHIHVHLLNVQRRFPRYLARFASRAGRDAWRREQGMKAMRPAQELLAGAGIPHSCHILTGEAASAIAGFADRYGCDRIVIGAGRTSVLTRILMGSVSADVVKRSRTPVEIVRRGDASNLAKYAGAAGIAGCLSLAYLAAE